MVFVLSIITAGASWADDHGNSCETATPIILDSSGNAEITAFHEYDDDVDFFRIDLPTRGGLWVSNQDSYGDGTKAELKNSNCENIEYLAGRNWLILAQVNAGTYYIAIHFAANPITIFFLEDDYGDSIETATEINLDSSGNGSINGTSASFYDWDYFKVNIPSTGSLSASIPEDHFVGGTEDYVPQLKFFDSDSTLIDHYGVGFNSLPVVAGNYFIAANVQPLFYHSYTLSVNFEWDTGDLTVAIAPPAAVSAGAQWRVDGGPWRNSGDTQSNFTVGSHTVEFKSISGWTTPGSRSVTINSNQTTAASGTYGGLVAYLPFNGNADDASGNGNGGSSLNVASVANPTCCVANGGDRVSGFDGNSILNVGSPASFNNMKSYTFMAWVWHTWDNYPYNYTSTKRQSITEKFGAFWLNIREDNRLRVGFPSDDDCSSGKKITRSDSQTKIQENVWTHVAATYDHNSDTIEIYINGNRSGTTALSSLCYQPINQYPTTIGGRYANIGVCQDCPDGLFYGYIDDVRYYSVALTQSQINQFKGSGKSNVSGTTCSQCISGGAPFSYGSLKVTLSPSGAVSAGAQWRVDGGGWRNSGTTVSNLSVGSHTVAFKSITGWTKPNNRTVTIASGQTTTLNRKYISEDNTPPEVLSVLPTDGSGIENQTRVPNNASFAVLLSDDKGIDIDQSDSAVFKISYFDAYASKKHTYYRSVDNESVRVVKLFDSEKNDSVTKLWLVYDKSREMATNRGNSYPFDTDVSITITAMDKFGNTLTSQVFEFKTETEDAHDIAADPANLPETTTLAGSKYTTIEVQSGNLEGVQLIYANDEPIKPRLGPEYDAVPELDVAYGVGWPLNLQPPTVFNEPVTVLIPCIGFSDVSDLSIYYYDGGQWKLACDASGNIQAGGEWCMVPGSRKNYNFHDDPANNDPSMIEMQVYHLGGLQVGANIPHTGSLSVTITPQGAIDAGAKWRVDESAWRDVSHTESNLSVGNHFVEFKAISGWITPIAQSVVIQEGQTTTVSGTYSGDGEDDSTIFEASKWRNKKAYHGNLNNSGDANWIYFYSKSRTEIDIKLTKCAVKGGIKINLYRLKKKGKKALDISSVSQNDLKELKTVRLKKKGTKKNFTTSKNYWHFGRVKSIKKKRAGSYKVKYVR